MKTLVKIQLRAILNKKNFFLLIGCITLFFFFQGFRLQQIFYIYELKGNAFDFFLFTIGGYQSPLLFSFLIGWLVLNLVFLYTSVSSSTTIDNFGASLISRIPNRIKLWISICITQFLMTIFILFLMIVIYLIVSYLLFDFKFVFSPYTFEFYSSVAKINLSINMIVLSIVTNFIIGLYSLFMLMHLFLNITLNKRYMYIIFLFICIFTSVFYIYIGLPKIFSPVFYPSTLSDNLSFNKVLSALGSNILISTLIIIIVGFIYRKKTFQI